MRNPLLCFFLWAAMFHTAEATSSIYTVLHMITNNSSDRDIVRFANELSRDKLIDENGYGAIIQCAIELDRGTNLINHILSLCPEDKRKYLIVSGDLCETSALETAFKSRTLNCSTSQKKSFLTTLSDMVYLSLLLPYVLELKSEKILRVMTKENRSGEMLIEIAAEHEKFESFALLFQNLKNSDKQRFLMEKYWYPPRSKERMNAQINNLCLGKINLFQRLAHPLCLSAQPLCDQKKIFRFFFNKCDAQQNLRKLIEEKGKDGKTLLHFVVMFSTSAKLVQIILDKYAHLVGKDSSLVKQLITSKDGEGNTALHYVGHCLLSKDQKGKLISYKIVKKLVRAYKTYISEKEEIIFKFLSEKNGTGKTLLDLLETEDGLPIHEFVLRYYPSQEKEERTLNIVKKFFLHEQLSSEKMKVMRKLYDQLSDENRIFLNKMFLTQ